LRPPLARPAPGRWASGRLVVVVGLVLLGACTPSRSEMNPPPAPPWLSKHHLDNPLVGRLWAPAEARFVTPDEAIARLAAADFILLGEQHDNPDQHRLQAWAIERLAARGRRPALAVEMLTAAQQAALDGHLAAHPGDAFGIGAAVGWAESGWPDWPNYAPIFAAALAAGMPIRAANLPRETLRRVVVDGPDAALGAERVAALRLKPGLPPELARRLEEEIAASHCDQLPENMVRPMAAAQRVRDAVMAEAMLQGAALPGRDGAVLIAGNGHARLDRGVPYDLSQIAPKRSVASLGVFEVATGAEAPADYAERFDGALPFDIVWFTPLADPTDPCESFAGSTQGARDDDTSSAP